MSTEGLKNHILKYKTEDGQWIEIPVFYQTAYQAYVDHFNQTKTNPDATPISVDEFYGVFTALADSDAMSALLDALSGADNKTIPVTLGGTGADDIETARQNLSVPSLEQHNNLQTELTEAIADINTVLGLGEEGGDGELPPALSERPTKQQVEELILESKESITLASLGISSGTEAPNFSTPGQIYLRIID